MSPRRRPRVVGISRDPVHSPLQHASNDAAILEATLGELERLGWVTESLGEGAVIEQPLPPAELYLNMAQGAPASRVLLGAEAAGIRFFNRPSSVLRCHRQRLVAALQDGELPFPETVLVRTDRPLTAAESRELEDLGAGPLWLKRGGVHAEREGDVRRLPREQLERGLAELRARRIPVAAVQRHVEGPVIKFYGVASDTFFHAYLAGSKAPVPPELLQPELLRDLAFRAAARLRLDVFGGDVVVTDAGCPVLIDLNDWPSFAPIRAGAARAIAGYVHALRPRGVLQ